MSVRNTKMTNVHPTLKELTAVRKGERIKDEKEQGVNEVSSGSLL